MELNKVYTMDFLNNTIADKSVQLIIADPPYFEVKGDFDFVWSSFDEYLKDVEKWVIECKRILADNGTLFWWGHAKKIAYSQIILDQYFNLVNSLVWRKKECQTLITEADTMRSFAPITERVLMYSNESDGMETSELNYTFQMGLKHTDIMQPIISYLISERDRAGFTNSMVDKSTGTSMASHWFCQSSQFSLPTAEWYNKLRILFNNSNKGCNFLRKDFEELRRPFNNNGKLQVDVLDYSQEANISRLFDHQTQKPEILTRSLILTSSRIGDTVCAPFAGSGTECAMAIKEGRKFIGFDVKKEYADMSNKRCANILISPKLF